MPDMFTPPSKSASSLALARLGIPSEFPVEGCFFTGWVLAFAEREGYTTLADLASTRFASEILDGTKKIPKFNVHSARSVLDFQEAVLVGDRERLRRFVPVSAQRDGIDLGFAAIHVATASGLGIDGLIERLVKGETLDNIGAWKKLTRERVRQIEKEYIDFISVVLDGIPEERARMWQAWARSRIGVNAQPDS